MYKPPPIIYEDREAGNIASSSWSNAITYSEFDGSSVHIGPSTARQTLHLSHFGLSGQAKWRLHSLGFQQFHVRGPLGERLLLALTLNGIDRLSDWILTPPIPGDLADIGSIDLGINRIDSAMFGIESFGVLVVREPAQAGTVELSYALLRAGTQRWDTFPIWEDPADQEDGEMGCVCSASGIWFPGSQLRETELGLRGEPFAGEE